MSQTEDHPPENHTPSPEDHTPLPKGTRVHESLGSSEFVPNSTGEPLKALDDQNNRGEKQENKCQKVQSHTESSQEVSEKKNKSNNESTLFNQKRNGSTSQPNQGNSSPNRSSQENAFYQPITQSELRASLTQRLNDLKGPATGSHDNQNQFSFDNCETSRSQMISKASLTTSQHELSETQFKNHIWGLASENPKKVSEFLVPKPNASSFAMRTPEKSTGREVRSILSKINFEIEKEEKSHLNGSDSLNFQAFLKKLKKISSKGFVELADGKQNLVSFSRKPILRMTEFFLVILLLERTSEIRVVSSNFEFIKTGFKRIMQSLIESNLDQLMAQKHVISAEEFVQLGIKNPLDFELKTNLAKRQAFEKKKAKMAQEIEREEEFLDGLLVQLDTQKGLLDSMEEKRKESAEKLSQLARRISVLLVTLPKYGEIIKEQMGKLSKENELLQIIELKTKEAHEMLDQVDESRRETKRLGAQVKSTEEKVKNQMADLDQFKKEAERIFDSKKEDEKDRNECSATLRGLLNNLIHLKLQEKKLHEEIDEMRKEEEELDKQTKELEDNGNAANLDKSRSSPVPEPLSPLSPMSRMGKKRIDQPNEGIEESKSNSDQFEMKKPTIFKFSTPSRNQEAQNQSNSVFFLENENKSSLRSEEDSQKLYFSANNPLIISPTHQSSKPPRSSGVSYSVLRPNASVLSSIETISRKSKSKERKDSEPAKFLERTPQKERELVPVALRVEATKRINQIKEQAAKSEQELQSLRNSLAERTHRRLCLRRESQRRKEETEKKIQEFSQLPESPSPSLMDISLPYIFGVIAFLVSLIALKEIRALLL